MNDVPQQKHGSKHHPKARLARRRRRSAVPTACISATLLFALYALFPLGGYNAEAFVAMPPARVTSSLALTPGSAASLPCGRRRANNAGARRCYRGKSCGQYIRGGRQQLVCRAKVGDVEGMRDIPAEDAFDLDRLNALKGEHVINWWVTYMKTSGKFN